jgi:hypothetical protein
VYIRGPVPQQIAKIRFREEEGGQAYSCTPLFIHAAKRKENNATTKYFP